QRVTDRLRVLLHVAGVGWRLLFLEQLNAWRLPVRVTDRHQCRLFFSSLILFYAAAQTRKPLGVLLYLGRLLGVKRRRTGVELRLAYRLLLRCVRFGGFSDRLCVVGLLGAIGAGNVPQLFNGRDRGGAQ